jgi:hypothetical protein
MKGVIALFSSLFCLSAFGQHVLPLQMDTTRLSNEILFYGQGEYAASAIQRQLSSALLFGGDITTEMKDLSFNRHKSVNRIGGELGGEFEYRNYNDSIFRPNLGWLVKVGTSNYASAAYSTDLFGLAFYGNEQYLGSSVEFSGTKFQYAGWLKAGIGLVDKVTKSSVSLNAYGITSFAQGEFAAGSVYQTLEGDSLHVELDGTVEYAGSNAFIKGWGVGLDADIRIPVQLMGDQVSYIQLMAKNLGIAFLTEPVTQYSLATSIGFKGFTFDELIGSSSLFSASTNWKDSLGIDSSQVKTSFFLPGFIQAGKMVDEMNPAKIQAFYGFRVYPTIVYNPLLFVGAQWKALPWLRIGAHGSYGGFTGVRIGMYGNVNLKSLNFSLGSEDLIGMFSNSGVGQSLLVRVRCVF